MEKQFCEAQSDCPISIQKPENFEKNVTLKMMAKMCCQQKMLLGQKVVCDLAATDRNLPRKIEV